MSDNSFFYFGSNLPYVEISDSSTAAKPIGTCPRCGTLKYENLIHVCVTSLKPNLRLIEGGADG